MSPVLPTAPVCLLRELPSRLEAVDTVCRELRALLTGSGWSGAAFAAELVARECLNNAVLHGNAGNPEKRVSFHLKCAGSRIRLCIGDEGRGFAPPEALSPRTPAPIATSGRGFSIVQTYAERVRFNRRGNQITVWLRPSACRQPEKL